MRRHVSDKLHVGLVLPSLAGGGAQRVILTLAEALIQRGHRVDLVVEELTGDYRAGVPQGIRVYRLRLRSLDRELLAHCLERGIEVNALTLNPVAAVWAWVVLNRQHRGFRVGKKHALYAYIVARYIRQARPQILLAAMQHANASALYGSHISGGFVPVVVSIHSDASRYTGDQPALARALYSRADAVVAVSKGVEGSAKSLLELDDERLHTVYNPIPHEEILTLARHSVFHPWFKDGESPVVLSVGRENSAKDYPTLVEAFGLLRARLRARLVIMGRFSEPYKQELIAQARGHGVDEDLGFVDFDENPYRYMRRASLFVLSSYREGLSTVLLEAIACGTPVVSTDARYGSDEILEGGRWGKLTPVRDAPALAQAMEDVLRGDRPSEEVLLRRAADFSCEQAADAYLELFEKVLVRRESR